MSIKYNPLPVMSYNLGHRKVKFQVLYNCRTVSDHIDSTRRSR